MVYLVCFVVLVGLTAFVLLSHKEEKLPDLPLLDVSKDIGGEMNVFTMTERSIPDAVVESLPVYDNKGEVFGEYPIIKEDEALRALSDGFYLTGSPDKFPGERYVEQAEIVYLTRFPNFDIPFYMFSVTNSEYTFYVPAIQPRYVENMPMQKAQ